jgi:hypothetical protein
MPPTFPSARGSGTRYERIAAINALDYYPDWHERQAALPAYDTAPFDTAMELTGNAIADLTLASSEPDASIVCYLSEVEADGTVRYVTEGLLRALHRKESPHPPEYQSPWPFRTYHRDDAAPLAPGVAERMRVVMLATSWIFKPGSRLRFSLAGTDADHIKQIPHGRPRRARLTPAAGPADSAALAPGICFHCVIHERKADAACSDRAPTDRSCPCDAVIFLPPPAPWPPSAGARWRPVPPMPPARRCRSGWVAPSPRWTRTSTTRCPTTPWRCICSSG